MASEYDYGCVSNTQVYGIEESIRRAKLPLSADGNTSSELTKGIKALAQSPPGEGHDQWLVGIVVQFDLTFSNKAWVEAERYHFLDFVSSQSTMHRITEFDLDDSYSEYVDERIVEIMKEKIKEYNNQITVNKVLAIYNNKESWTINPKKTLDEMYLGILYSNPAGFKITAGMTTNYRQLKTIYRQRKNHTLPEWREFCKWIEGLPMSELITGKEPDEDKNSNADDEERNDV